MEDFFAWPLNYIWPSHWSLSQAIQVIANIFSQLNMMRSNDLTSSHQIIHFIGNLHDYFTSKSCLLSFILNSFFWSNISASLMFIWTDNSLCNECTFILITATIFFLLAHLWLRSLNLHTLLHKQSKLTLVWSFHSMLNVITSMVC